MGNNNNELSYFPPGGGRRWRWSSKSLSYSPWLCRLAEQMKPAGTILHPADVVLSVGLAGGKYVWRVTVTDWTYGRHDKAGTASTAQEAIASAEEIGEEAFKDLTPPWVLMALENGWRPPLPRS